ncbi:hypothetical protein AAIB41_07385 [Brucella sp. BE17]|uniref:hypothetical protein n=1 Tax=Brucella sp. BE17 TaxID=3142977 RepID=UPI0031BB2D5B
MRSLACQFFICVFGTYVLLTGYAAAQTGSEGTDIMFKRIFTGFRKQAHGAEKAEPSLTKLQTDIVRAIVADRTDLHDFDWEDRDWIYIAVNHELLVDSGARSSTQTAILAQKPGGLLEDLSFRLSMATKQKFRALQEAMQNKDKEPWTIVDITIERDGRYDFVFAYDPPPRINGDLLYSPLTGLLERFKAERGVK